MLEFSRASLYYMFDPIDTLAVRQWECLPETWEWLAAQLHTELSVIRMVVGSRLHHAFSRRLAVEFKKRKKPYEQWNGPISEQTAVLLARHYG